MYLFLGLKGGVDNKVPNGVMEIHTISVYLLKNFPGRVPALWPQRDCEDPEGLRGVTPYSTVANTSYCNR